MVKTRQLSTSSLIGASLLVNSIPKSGVGFAKSELLNPEPGLSVGVGENR